MRTYERVFRHIGNEPRGHCEAMKNRCINSLKIANEEIKKQLKGK